MQHLRNIKFAPPLRSDTSSEDEDTDISHDDEPENISQPRRGSGPMNNTTLLGSTNRYIVDLEEQEWQVNLQLQIAKRNYVHKEKR